MFSGSKYMHEVVESLKKAGFTEQQIMDELNRQANKKPTKSEVKQERKRRVLSVNIGRAWIRRRDRLILQAIKGE